MHIALYYIVISIWNRLIVHPYFKAYGHWGRRVCEGPEGLRSRFFKCFPSTTTASPLPLPVVLCISGSFGPWYIFCIFEYWGTQSGWKAGAELQKALVPSCKGSRRTTRWKGVQGGVEERLDILSLPCCLTYLYVPSFHFTSRCAWSLAWVNIQHQMGSWFYSWFNPA